MSRDILIGRQGDSMVGQVLDKSFSIRASFGTQRIETRRITWIHFKNPPNTPADEIWLKTGDRLSGTVEAKSVRFKTDGGETLDVPRAAIHTIVIDGATGRRARALR